MSRINLYNAIFERNRNNLLSGNVGVDDVLSRNGEDPRLGISLIIPIRTIELSYRNLVESIKSTEPEQYYYPLSDLHITIFDYIRGNDRYSKDAYREELFAEITKEALRDLRPFRVDFRGIVFSSEAGLIQGFDGGCLIRIRERIRRVMEERGVSNDERYKSESAHVTFCRFRARLHDPAELVRSIEKNRGSYIGMETVESVELVEHDWYNKREKKRVIGTFALSAVGS